MFDPNRFYGIAQVADFLGVKRWAIWSRRKTGKMPALHGSCGRFRGDQLNRWLAGDGSAAAFAGFDARKTYSSIEVAAVIGVTRQAVWLWARPSRAKLPPLHGSCHRFLGSELRAWAEDGRDWSDMASSTCSDLEFVT